MKRNLKFAKHFLGLNPGLLFFFNWIAAEEHSIFEVSFRQCLLVQLSCLHLFENKQPLTKSKSYKFRRNILSHLEMTKHFLITRSEKYILRLNCSSRSYILLYFSSILYFIFFPSKLKYVWQFFLRKSFLFTFERSKLDILDKAQPICT